MSVSADLAGSRQDEVAAPTRDEVLAFVAGAMAMAAGAIHLVVTPHHLAEAPLVGAFFLVLGLGQLVLAVCFRLVLGVRTLVVVVAAHVVVIALYVATRTVELPFVPPHDAGHDIDHLPVAGGIGNGVPIYPGSRIEPIGAIDVTCLGAELVLVVVVCALLPAQVRARVTTVVMVLAVAAGVLRVMSL